MKKAKAGSTDTDFLGRGPVRYKFLQGPGGPLQVGIDFSLAQPPGAYFYADCVSLKRDRDLAMAVLSFGRFDLNAGRFSERLDIVMPDGGLFFQFWNSSRDVEKTVDEQLKVLGLPSASRTITSKSLARATLFANCIFVSTGGGESCLDFYYMPIRDIHLAKAARRDISLEAIIRVLTSPAVLKSLFDLCRPYATIDDTQLLHNNRSNRANAS